MKNITLIKQMIAAFVQTSDEKDLISNLTALITAHPAEIRENALALLVGSAELTVRPTSQVEIVSRDSNFTDPHFSSEAMPNFLAGKVEVRIIGSSKETHWYKSQEDADDYKNSSHYKHDDYTIDRSWCQDIQRTFTFDLADWNSGCVFI